MLFVLPASFISVVDRITSIVGTVATILVGVFGVYLAIRRFRQSKMQKEIQDDKEVLNRFADVERTAEIMAANFKHLRSEVSRSHETLSEQFAELADTVAIIQQQCVRHNQSYELADLRKDVDRLNQLVDRWSKELVDHRQNVSDRYLTTSSYHGDMQMLSQTFNTFQQSLRDLQFMMNRGANQ